jgi:tetratricopeptide (TPR) repeat protein
MSEEFLEWIRETLGLSFLASRLKSLSKLANFSERLIGFLSVIDYFDEVRLSKLKEQLIEWEARLEWERLKERADYLVQKNDPERAYGLYRQALSYGENKQILNNLAVTLMKLEHYEQAETYFERALAAMPYEDTCDNLQLLLNLAEAAIYSHKFVRAEESLREAEKIDPNTADISYLYGELNVETDNILHSIDFFERALNMEYDPHFIYRISEIYMRLRKYDQAFEVLARIIDKNAEFLTHQANLYAAANNIPAAIKCIERAILAERDNCSLWMLTARYHRMNYDLDRANTAIVHALILDPNNNDARLESARIKKAQGKTKDYQVVLHNVLDGFKQKYRDFM